MNARLTQQPTWANKAALPFSNLFEMETPSQKTTVCTEFAFL